MNGLGRAMRGSLACAAALLLLSCGSTDPVVFPNLVIETNTLPSATRGQPYEAAIRARGGDEAFSWAVTAGALPSGLTLMADDLGEDHAVVSGIPDQEGIYDFTVTVTSGDGQTASAALRIDVLAQLALAIDKAFVPPALVGGPYDVNLPVQGAAGAALEWRVASGTPPAGLALTADGRIEGTPTTPGSSRFTVEVRRGAETASRTYDLDVVPHRPDEYRITVFPIGSITAGVRAHLEEAVAQWERALPEDLPAIAIPPGFFPSDFCSGFGELLNGTSTDDILIAVRIEAIDGPGGVLGRAGPCGLRSGTDLPFAGSLVLDSDDLTPLVGNETLTYIISHEIAHVLGFGTLWQRRSLIEGVQGADPRFTGTNAMEAYAELGGEGAVPVESQGGEGTRDAHWRQTVFGNERMTGFSAAPGVAQPLSIVSLASLLDLGYTVDLSAADDFSLSAGLAADGAAQELLGHDHVLMGPVRTLEPGLP